MFLKIGERINSSRKDIAAALKARDEAAIRKEARLQKEAGADMLDVNCAFNSKDEPADMGWLVELVQNETGLPLSIDSPNPKALESGLRRHKGRALINSATLERSKLDSILPLAKNYDADIIILTMDEKGMPSTEDGRLALAKKALDTAKAHGIRKERLYIDPLVRPVSSEQRQGLEVIKSVRAIKSRFEARTICGLSNVSFGLPARTALNSVFLTMLLSAGLDAAILDVSEKKIKTAIRAAEALLGRDNFCTEYLKSYRSGEIEK